MRLGGFERTVRSPAVVFDSTTTEPFTASSGHQSSSRAMTCAGTPGATHSNGLLRFRAPAFTKPGPQALYAERGGLVAWRGQGLQMVWTTLCDMHWSPP